MPLMFFFQYHTFRDIHELYVTIYYRIVYEKFGSVTLYSDESYSVIDIDKYHDYLIYCTSDPTCELKGLTAVKGI